MSDDEIIKFLNEIETLMFWMIERGKFSLYDLYKIDSMTIRIEQVISRLKGEV